MKFGVEEKSELIVTTNALGNDDIGFKLFHECGDCQFSQVPLIDKGPEVLCCQNRDCLVEQTRPQWSPAQAHQHLMEKYLEDITCKHEELGISCYRMRQ